MRIRRWLGWAAISGVVLVIVVIMTVWVTSRTDWGRNKVRLVIEERAARVLDGTLAVERVEGNLVDGIRLEGVRFTHANREVVTAKSIEARFSLWGWLRGGRDISLIRVVDPVVRLTDQRNSWDVASWLRPRPAALPGAALRLRVVEVANGRVLVTADAGLWRLPPELREMNGVVAVTVDNGTRIDFSRLAFTSGAGVATFHARAVTGTIALGGGARFEKIRIESNSGTLSLDGRIGPGAPRPVSLNATFDRFDSVKWRPWSPLLDTIDLTADGTAAFGGNMDQLTIHTALATSAGGIEADTLIATVPGVVRITGTTQLARFDAQHVTNDPQWASRLTGRGQYTVVGTGTPADWVSDIKFDGGPMEALGARADRADGTMHYAAGVVTFATTTTAYGASGRARGTIRTGSVLTIDATGDELMHLNPRLLPPEWGYTPLEADLNASAYTVHWTPGGWTVKATLKDSVAEGATLLSGTTVDLAGSRDFISVSADGNVRSLDARRMGIATGLTGLDDPIFVTDLNGHVKLSGQGRNLTEIDLTAQAELGLSRAAVGATIPSATVSYTRRSHLNTAHIIGPITNLNPATLGASPALASTLNGHADFVAVWRDDVPNVAETMTARGTFRANASVISELPITRGVVTGEWRDGAFTMDSATLENSGLTLTGRGRVAVTRGTSDATFEVNATDVISLQPWSGRAAHGAATARGNLSGTFDAPRVKVAFESLRVSDPDLGTFGGLSGNLDAVFPEWFLDKMRGDLQLQAASWANEKGPVAESITSQSRFTTRFHVSESRVQATVGETLLRATLSADWEKELTTDISALEARRGAQAWMLDATSGRLRITTTHLSAENVQLSNGPQHIAVSGRVALSEFEAGGDPGDVLSLRATAIDLAALDEFLGMSIGATGLVSGDATLVGRLSDPRGRITLSSRDLKVRGYAIATAGGTIDLANGAAVSDLTLAQPDGVTMKITGRAPLTWLLPEGTLDPAVPSPAWDLTAVSDPIKLAILGAVNPRLTEIGGEMIVDLRVIGAAAAPKVTGTVAVADGSFHLPAFGTAFSGVHVDIGLGTDTITVRRFRALDKDGHALTMTGQLAVNEREIGRVEVNVEADRFIILDNAIGDVAVSSLLQLQGDAAHPRLTGNLEVASGRIEVDRLLQALQGDPGALVAEKDLPAEGTTAVDLRAEAAAAAAEAAARKQAPSRFDSRSFLSKLAVDVQILAPDNLSLRGSELRPGGRNSWSLGDLNATVGGDVRATRVPGELVRLRGEVTVVRGVYSFEGKRFDIQRGGRIRFQGESPLDPTFDIRGVRTIQGVEARVDVRGRLSEPSLQLGSNLPLDEGDILSMIIFNRPVNQLGDTQRADLVGAAASMAGGFVTSPLARSLGKSLNLDLLEVEAVTFGDNVAPRIRVGEQLTSRLFVQLSQQFGAQSLSEFTAEYRLAKFLRLQASTAQGPGSRAQGSLLQRAERFGLDLLFFFNF